MRSRFQQKIHLVLVSFLLFSLLLTPQVVQAQATVPIAAPDPMEKCRRLAFSTEEDFMMTDGKPSDGDPYISDGDLLSPLGDVCMRNRQLLQRFAPAGALYPSDLGLDGLDILNVEKKIIAFFTQITIQGLTKHKTRRLSRLA